MEIVLVLFAHLLIYQNFTKDSKRLHEMFASNSLMFMDKIFLKYLFEWIRNMQIISSYEENIKYAKTDIFPIRIYVSCYDSFLIGYYGRNFTFGTMV